MKSDELGLPEAQQLLKNGCLSVTDGAPSSSTPEAAEFFKKNGILYAPHKLAGLAGSAFSKLERDLNKSGQAWSKPEVDTRLRELMRDVFRSCSYNFV